MKTLIIFAAAVLVSFTNGQSSNADWPQEVKKCSKNDPDFNNCLVFHANRALPYVFGGDSSTGGPSYSPYIIGNLTFGNKQSFKLHLTDAKIFGMDHIYVSKMNWDLKNRNITIDFNFHAAAIIHGPFTSTGNFKGLDLTGKGMVDMVFVGGDQGGKLSYNMHYDMMKVRGKEYIQIRNRECTRQEGFRLQFTNELKTREQAKSDMDNLNKNSVDANKAIDPEMRELICVVVDNALNPIFNNFDMDQIFD